MEVNIEAVDWENLLNFDIPEDLDGFFDAIPAAEVGVVDEAVAPAGVESWMGELEELLMKDDYDNAVVIDDVAKSASSNQLSGFQVSELFADLERSSEPEVVNKNSPSHESSPSVGNDIGVGGGSPNSESNEENENYKSDGGVVGVNDDDDDDENDDPATKKRKRQLRNRDAAMRSRERKKMYVKDLEAKSKYMEMECRRLGRMLECCYADNVRLRYSLECAYRGPMTKPESAVLLLESLLLGSLVWLMVNICMLPQHMLHLLDHQDAAIMVNVGRKEQESAAPKRRGTQTSELWIALSFMRSKRCRASRTKMKSHFERGVLCN